MFSGFTINYSVLVYCVIGISISILVTYVIQYFVIKSLPKNKKTRKKLKKECKNFLNKIRIGVFAFWFILCIIFFGMNPAVHNTPQEDMNYPEDEIVIIPKEKLTKIIKKKENEPLVDLRITDKESEEEYKTHLCHFIDKVENNSLEIL